MKKVRKKGYWFLFILTVIITLAAISTFLPDDGASKPSLLGYYAHCSYTPLSSIICALLAALTCFIRRRILVTYR